MCKKTCHIRSKNAAKRSYSLFNFRSNKLTISLLHLHNKPRVFHACLAKTYSPCVLQLVYASFIVSLKLARYSTLHDNIIHFY